MRNNMMYVLSRCAVDLLTRVSFCCLLINTLGISLTVRHSSPYIIPYAIHIIIWLVIKFHDSWQVCGQGIISTFPTNIQCCCIFIFIKYQSEICIIEAHLLIHLRGYHIWPKYICGGQPIYIIRGWFYVSSFTQAYEKLYDIDIANKPLHIHVG